MANKNFEKKSKRFLAILLAAGLAFSPISQSTAFATEVEETEGEAGQDTAQDEAAAAGSGVEEGGQAVENVEVSSSEKKEAQKEAVFEESPDSIKGHKKIAENDLVEMYLKEENLSLIIRNKANGAIMESTVSDPDNSLNTTWRSFIQSGVGFLILNGLNEERSDLLSADADIKVSVNADGFTADVTLKKYEISFRMTVALEGEGFTVEIPSESIKEEQKDVTIGHRFD